MLKTLGKNSLAILCWHLPLSNVFYSYFISLLPNSLQNIAWGGNRSALEIIMAIIMNMAIVIPVSIGIHNIILKK